MKKILLVLALAGLGNIQTTSADIINAVGSFFKTPQPYSNTPGSKNPYGVEVLNKTGKKIWVVVINGAIQNAKYNEIPTEIKSKSLLEDGNRAFETNIDQQTSLAIWTEKPKQQIDIQRDITPKFISAYKYKVTPKPAWYVEFSKGKTAYVTVDKNGVRPQTGPRNGAAGMTDSGLSLKNNVTVGDIKVIKQ